jgi:hypothetical protein
MPSSVQPRATPVSACLPEVIKALADIKALAADVQRASIEATVAAEAYQSLQQRVTALGGIVDEATRRELVQAKQRSEGTAATLIAARKKLDKAKEVVAHVNRFLWPRDGATFRDTEKVPGNLLALWMEPEFKDQQPAPQAVLLRLGIGDPDTSPTEAAGDATTLGLPYRMPLAGKFYACGDKCDPANQLAEYPVSILQLGPTYYLPCQSQTFGSTSCSFTVDENGVPSAVGTEQKASAAEAAALLSKDLATQYAEYRVARRDAEKTAYEAETARLKAKADYEKALAAQAPNPTQGVIDATNTYKAYADYYTAMKAYEDAKKAAKAP